LFDLSIDKSVFATGVGDKGSTGAQPVSPGQHTVAEGTDTSLSVPVEDEQNVVCTITNTRLTGTVTIAKVTTDGSPPSFPFTGTVGPDWTLANGQSKDFVLTPGKYTATELIELVSGYQLQSIACSDSADETGASTVSGPTATIDLQANEKVTCTFTNKPGGGILPTTTGTAAIRGAHGCVRGPLAISNVFGTRISRVTFYLNGHKIKVLTKRNTRSYYQLRTQVRHIHYGRSTVKAVVQFESDTTPSRRTLTQTFSRCPAPRVTG
jgi:hypothetical protein